MGRHNTNVFHRTGRLLLTAGIVAVLAVTFQLSANAGQGGGGGKGRVSSPPLDATAYGKVPAGFSSWAEVLREA